MFSDIVILITSYAFSIAFLYGWREMKIGWTFYDLAHVHCKYCTSDKIVYTKRDVRKMADMLT